MDILDVIQEIKELTGLSLVELRDKLKAMKEQERMVIELDDKTARELYERIKNLKLPVYKGE